ncbi:MAG: deoxyribodipyrimidine photo-lyase [Alphaproteobacteria bacterium]|nr:deoxyribodipyrimidine photo-lyase [Alphaproteobacteria bacterium SS10]
MSKSTFLHWFRRDLRLADNPALMAAIDATRSAGGELLLLYIHDDEGAGEWAWGGAHQWWLDKSLKSLSDDVSKIGGSLVLKSGDASKIIDEVVEAHNIQAVFWNRCYEPFAIARDKQIKQGLKDRGVEVESFNGSVLNEPWTIKTKTGGPYRVYTPYWRCVVDTGGIEKPLAAPSDLPPSPGVNGEALEDWALHPTKPDWSGGLAARWEPGEAAAAKRLVQFLEGNVTKYDVRRDFPGEHGTSRLSPHLHWGEISPRQIWHATVEKYGLVEDTKTYLKEIVWREFSYHLLYHYPHLPTDPLQEKFARFPWREDADDLKAWQDGMTGIPIVDAGMRELYETGWMHNRVRMIVGSFLVKNLLLHWTEGERWFWDCLVDGDLASNSAGWQWIGGCGADAAPYFRVFNPVTQGERYDKDGAYVRRFVPELRDLPDKYLHQPWEAPPIVLQGAGVKLGSTYPKPRVDLKQSRQRALDAFQQIKN